MTYFQNLPNSRGGNITTSYSVPRYYPREQYNGMLFKIHLNIIEFFF